MKHNLPKHIAIVMDGNGRWAKQRFLPRIAGHKKGVVAVKVVIKRALEVGVNVLSLFAFSSENWQRPSAEVEALFELLLISLTRELNLLIEQGVRLRFIGDHSKFNQNLQEAIKNAEAATSQNDRLDLVVALNYGGRWDIVNATQQIAALCQSQQLSLDTIDEALLSEHLTLAQFPEPDLFIRTSGEQRISNFFLWQLAYTELYFPSCYWPDFDEAAFDEAINFYQQRERRFGKTTEQTCETHHVD